MKQLEHHSSTEIIEKLLLTDMIIVIEPRLRRNLNITYFNLCVLIKRGRSHKISDFLYLKPTIDNQPTITY